MKSKNFSFSFAEDISKFTILGRDIRKTRDLYKVYKNVTTSIIVILDCLEVDIKILDIGMENTVFDEYREILESNGIANEVLAITQERTRFFYKDK